jgi:hypothetical protein
MEKVFYHDSFLPTFIFNSHASIEITFGTSYVDLIIWPRIATIRFTRIIFTYFLSYYFSLKIIVYSFSLIYFT